MLPKDLQQRLIAELDNRLDLDLDELLESPKLRVKLSPAKLDKLLLELYDSVTTGPSGDVFRVIGGGANVGRQHLYLKQQQSKLNKLEYDATMISDAVDGSTPTGLVQRALKRNFSQQSRNRTTTTALKSANDEPPSKRGQTETPKMSLNNGQMKSDPSWGVRLVQQGSFAPYRSPRPRYSPLI